MKGSAENSFPENRTVFSVLGQGEMWEVDISLYYSENVNLYASCLQLDAVLCAVPQSRGWGIPRQPLWSQDVDLDALSGRGLPACVPQTFGLCAYTVQACRGFFLCWQRTLG